MDWLTFIAGVIESLAWPLALLVAVFAFRGQFGRLGDFVEKIKYRDVEVNFRQQFQAIRQEAEAASITLIRPIGTIGSSLREEAKDDPSILILEGWRLVSESFVRLASSNEYPFANYTPENGAALERDGHIDKSLRNIMDDLLRTRNSVVHARNATITMNEGIDYFMLTKSVSERLEQRIGRQRDPVKN